MSIQESLQNKKVYLVEGKRTPFGSFGGSLMGVSPVDLAVESTKATLTASGLSATEVDHFILGNVIPTTTDTLYGGRHLALKCGASQETPGYGVNRLCGSGIQSILEATYQCLLGEASSVIAAGTENMSNTPHLLYGSRFGTRYGAPVTGDLLLDSLTDKYAGCPMGITAENLASKFNISRLECEEFSFHSHQKASRAIKEGLLKEEVIEMSLKKGILSQDEHVRFDINLEGMQKLRSSFKKDGVVTPATASGIVDGAASTLIASEDFIQAKNLKPLARIVDIVVVGVDPTIMGIGPAPAIRKLLERNSMSLDQIDLVEINEAFAAQVLACQKDLELDNSKLNIWGGAVAVGHPLAATGTRISLTLARQLKKLNKKYGIASACIGGGQGIALLLEN